MTEFRSELSSLRPQQRTADEQMNLRAEAARHSGWNEVRAQAERRPSRPGARNENPRCERAI
jgi:hypothetical protein